MYVEYWRNVTVEKPKNGVTNALYVKWCNSNLKFVIEKNSTFNTIIFGDFCEFLPFNPLSSNGNMLTVWLFPNSMIRTQWIILTQENTLHGFNWYPHNNRQWYQNTCNINCKFVENKSLWIVYLIQLKCKSFLFRLESTCKRDIEFPCQIQ